MIPPPNPRSEPKSPANMELAKVTALKLKTPNDDTPRKFTFYLHHEDTSKWLLRQAHAA